jgi:SulP family sulfate permease
VDRVLNSKNVAIIFYSINEIDSSGTEMLKELHGQLQHKGIKLLFVGVKRQVQDVLQASGLVERVGEENFFGTFEHAREAVYERLAFSAGSTYSI